MSSSEEKKVTLKSCDEAIFEVDEVVAMQMHTIKHIIEEDDCVTNTIPLPNVHSKFLSKVIEYCKNHVEGDGDADDSSTKDNKDKLKAFDTELVHLDLSGLFEFIIAANYLNVKALMDLISQTVADMIKDKSVEEIRVIFDVKNDFTPEEEAELRKENEWAFE